MLRDFERYRVFANPLFVLLLPTLEREGTHPDPNISAELLNAEVSHQHRLQGLLFRSIPETRGELSAEDDGDDSPARRERPSGEVSNVDLTGRESRGGTNETLLTARGSRSRWAARRGATSREASYGRCAEVEEGSAVGL